MNNIKRLPAVDGSLGWYKTSSVQRKSSSLRASGKQHYDFVVVGAGFTGLALAGRLAELHPNAQIAIVDALKVGQGTSGRNAGFIIDLPHNLDSEKPNPERDSKIRELNEFAIQRLDEIQARQQSGECWQKVGKYLAANEEKHFKNLEGFTRTLDVLGADYEVLEGPALSSRLGTSYYRKAVYTSGNILVNPAALAITVANDLPDNVTLYEDTPIRAIDLKEKKLTHDRGELIADSLVLAANSFTEELGGCKNKLAPIFTYASLTRQLNDQELRRFSGISPWGVTSAHPAGSTVRFTSDKRLFVRNSFDVLPKLSSNSALIEKAKVQHRKSFGARFPGLESVDFEHSWGGMLCMTMSHEPVFEQKNQGVYVVAGMDGVGVAKGTYLGYHMAEFIAGNKSETLDYIFNNSSPSWMPPDPLKTIGARVRLFFEQKLARGEV
jgi:glycine/D-amino acid oxidase-like deaminating enzyme